jgi:hypothetical protein
VAFLLNQDTDIVRRIIEWVRMFMRDYPELNRLTKGQDHSDRHIYWAILDTLSDWSATPPFIGQGDLQFITDRGWDGLFAKGVVIDLMTSLGILHTRNFLSYSDGGMNVQTENPQLIQSWLQMFKAEYEEKKQRALIAANIENALESGPGVHSEYVFVNSFFGSL